MLLRVIFELERNQLRASKIDYYPESNAAYEAYMNTVFPPNNKKRPVSAAFRPKSAAFHRS